MISQFSIEKDNKEYELRMLMQQTESNIYSLDQVIKSKHEFSNLNPTEVATRLRDMSKKMNANH